MISSIIHRTYIIRHTSLIHPLQVYQGDMVHIPQAIYIQI
nr:MAG TPA: hypothetical protein [Herelleviridae sp. ctUqP11]DAY18482.1 MAG TPA: hypothetical protein [Caudoviricetes sp.]